MKYFEETFDLEIKERILEVYGKTSLSFKKDLEDLKVWLKTQPHLPQVLSDRQLETYMILCKCNLDKVKLKIDMYFTMRFRFLNVFTDYHPSSERMKQARKFISYIPLPKLCSNLGRIFLAKVNAIDDLTDLDPYACLAHMMNIIEVRFLEDVCCSHTLLIDVKHVTIGHLVKVTPMVIKTMYIIGDRALTTRVNAIHIVNASNFVDHTIFLVKSIVKPKLAERIVIHRGIDSALESLEKDVLPKDYGGNQNSSEELEAMLVQKMDEYKDFFDEREHWKVDEELRPEKFKDEGFFGCYGNFKQLQVD